MSISRKLCACLGIGIYVAGGIAAGTGVFLTCFLYTGVFGWGSGGTLGIMLVGAGISATLAGFFVATQSLDRSTGPGAS